MAERPNDKPMSVKKKTKARTLPENRPTETSGKGFPYLLKLVPTLSSKGENEKKSSIELKRLSPIPITARAGGRENRKRDIGPKHTKTGAGSEGKCLGKRGRIQGPPKKPVGTCRQTTNGGGNPKGGKKRQRNSRGPTARKRNVHSHNIRSCQSERHDG